MHLPPLIRVAFLLLLVDLFWAPASNSRDLNLDMLNHRWKAFWITCSDGPQREFGVFHFRKTFSLSSVPQHFVIHVSGDNRYELFVNGAQVLAGPARGDLNHWRYETLDIGSHLRAGKNVLAAAVWNFAELAPMAQMTNQTGLIVQGDGAAEAAVNTDATWRSFRNLAVEMVPLDQKKVPFYTVVGPGERVDASRYLGLGSDGLR